MNKGDNNNNYLSDLIHTQSAFQTAYPIFISRSEPLTRSLTLPVVWSCTGERTACPPTPVEPSSAIMKAENNLNINHNATTIQYNNKDTSTMPQTQTIHSSVKKFKEIQKSTSKKKIKNIYMYIIKKIICIYVLCFIYTRGFSTTETFPWGGKIKLGNVPDLYNMKLFGYRIFKVWGD